MAKVHDLFIVELAEVIKGYGNDPDDKDPFRMSEFYRFYELPNIAVSRENFEKMLPIDPVRKGKWIDKHAGIATCSECGDRWGVHSMMKFCPSCGAKMEEGD